MLLVFNNQSYMGAPFDCQGVGSLKQKIHPTCGEEKKNTLQKRKFKHFACLEKKSSPKAKSKKQQLPTPASTRASNPGPRPGLPTRYEKKSLPNPTS
jgi:hypothetical protein